MLRYQVYVGGLRVGSAETKPAALDLVLELGGTLPVGSKLSFQLRLGKEVVGEGELDIEARD